MTIAPRLSFAATSIKLDAEEAEVGPIFGDFTQLVKSGHIYAEEKA